MESGYNIMSDGYLLFVVKNIRTVSKITFDCIYFTFVKTLFPYENVFVVEKEKIVIKEPEKKRKRKQL